MKTTVLSFTASFSIFICLTTILGYLGSVYWIFDLFSHFRFQYLVILLLAFFVFLFFRKKSLMALAFLFFLPNAYEVASLYWGGNKMENLQHYLKISSINLLSTNEHNQAVVDFIRSKNPDVLVLQEFNAHWEDALSAVIKSYPYHKLVTRTDNFGIAILSKIKIQNVTDLNLSPVVIPSLLATLVYDGRTLQVLATHPVPPVGQQAFHYRNRQLESMVAMKNVLNGNLIVIGDLNITPFSIHFKRLLKGLNLVDSQKGFGMLATWPTWLPIMQIPIDHCLVSRHMFVKDRRVGKPVGSDHLPIYAEVGFE